ncbi:MAG: Ig-like domain-containing protein, partial [Deltaproteobacteria bacterium]
SLYKNGSMTKSFQTSLDTSTSTNLVVGQRSGVDGFVGFIDDIRIYDRPLNAAEVQALYHVYDPQPPFVVDTTPDNGTSIGVSDNLTLRFSEAIDQSTLGTAITLKRDNGTQVAIDNLTFDNASSPFSLTIDPGADYTADNYTLRISTALKDLSGNSLREEFVLDFEAQ